MINKKMDIYTENGGGHYHYGVNVLCGDNTVEILQYGENNEVEGKVHIVTSKSFDSDVLDLLIDALSDAKETIMKYSET